MSNITISEMKATVENMTGSNWDYCEFEMSIISNNFKGGIKEKRDLLNVGFPSFLEFLENRSDENEKYIPPAPLLRRYKLKKIKEKMKERKM